MTHQGHCTSSQGWTLGGIAGLAGGLPLSQTCPAPGMPLLSAVGSCVDRDQNEDRQVSVVDHFKLCEALPLKMHQTAQRPIPPMSLMSQSALNRIVSVVKPSHYILPLLIIDRRKGDERLIKSNSCRFKHDMFHPLYAISQR